ncbi:hypothetical protein DRJ48_02520 [Candidatus Woesearchaeota archaeon]|nr:MAG: hypothetical protein DRJ48_02520 [Candidatus Woesearchaeota archaeon]
MVKKGFKDVWFIDPLSSTRNYIHGLPHFGVALTLQRRGEFVLGIVRPIL